MSTHTLYSQSPWIGQPHDRVLALAAPHQGIRSFSINSENRSGERGQAAKASSNLGPSRKGSPAVLLEAGQTYELANITGSGVIRHIWMTVPDETSQGGFVLRDLVLRFYWDDDEQPAIEVPLGDFFCCGFGRRNLVESDLIVVAPTGGLNCYIPMPFASNARITITNEHPAAIDSLYFQIDGTLGDRTTELGRLHARWNRSNGSLPLGTDHQILERIEGAGTYLGSFISLCSLQRSWWGEGEVKFYLDQDSKFPTLCSTGLEDYAGGAWAFQDQLSCDGPVNPMPFSSRWCGYPSTTAEDDTHTSPFDRSMPPQHSLYRWHIPDPVYFDSALSVTVQMIGANNYGLFERSDDICSVAYWYQTSGPSNYVPLADRASRQPR